MKYGTLLEDVHAGNINIILRVISPFKIIKNMGIHRNNAVSKAEIVI